MTPEEYQWTIGFCQNRYEFLHLSVEQAEQIYRFEQDRDASSDKHFFSTWEEWDYEVSSFQQILSADQFHEYEKHIAKRMKEYEKGLVTADQERKRDIAYLQERIAYYKSEFLPDLYKDPFIFIYPAMRNNRAKVDFLKAEYKLFLTERKKAILTEHFRQNRLFAPNALQVELLRHHLDHLWPDYFAFKRVADESVKTVIEHMIKSFTNLGKETEDLVSKKLTELRIFSEAMHHKYYSDRNQGYTYVLEFTPEEENENRMMTLLLLDKNKYSNHPISSQNP